MYILFVFVYKSLYTCITLYLVIASQLWNFTKVYDAKETNIYYLFCYWCFIKPCMVFIFSTLCFQTNNQKKDLKSPEHGLGINMGKNLNYL